MPNAAALQPNEILFEDNHLLVINKRAGLITQGAPAGTPNLFELAKDYVRIKYNKPGNVYLGIVSRLDAKTTGVIVIARTSKSAARLSNQFRQHQPKKLYWAIVGSDRGTIADEGQQEDWLIKDDAAMRMRCVTKSTEGAKFAKLSWRAIGKFQDKTILEIELETGRKHQIRCQLAAMGFPILGDRKYGSNDEFPSPGIALHSKSIQLTHPTKNNLIRFEAEVPSYWKIARYNL